MLNICVTSARLVASGSYLNGQMNAEGDRAQRPVKALLAELLASPALTKHIDNAVRAREIGPLWYNNET